jgi:hypothetical protein
MSFYKDFEDEIQSTKRGRMNTLFWMNKAFMIRID